MLEFWKRKQVESAFKWGMLDFEASEAYRAEFIEDGRVRVAGEEVLYFDPRKRRWLYAYSFGVMLTLCCTVVGVVAGIQRARFVMLQNPQLAEYAVIIAAFMNVVQITFFAQVYFYISTYLNDAENHAYVFAVAVLSWLNAYLKSITTACVLML